MKSFVFRSIILVTVVMVLFTAIANHQKVDATKNNSNHNSKHHSKGSTIPLPFNSHIAADDDGQSSTHKKKDSSSSGAGDGGIPFP